jgi:hypothetical protein
MHEEETWSPEHLDYFNDGENGSIMQPFLSSSSPQRRHWSWSWTFVFRGRRRRMTLHAPSWEALKDLLALLGDGVAGDASFKRRGILQSTAMDFLSVAWVFMMMWIAMAWWSS